MQVVVEIVVAPPFAAEYDILAVASEAEVVVDAQAVLVAQSLRTG